MSLFPGTMTLADLSKRAGMTPRTVRFYLQRGLLLAPRFRGRHTGYKEENLPRLQAIRRLQDRFLPLDAIKLELQRMTPEQIRDLAKGGKPPPAPPIAPDPTTAKVDDVATWQRWQLAPGLELHLSQSADGRSRALAESILELARSG